MESDDPASPKTKLSVAGQVERFATITPRVVRFNGRVGEPMKATVTVIPEPQHPFVIKKIRAHRDEFVKYELSEGQTDDGRKQYTITVENTKEEAGAYYDVLILETDSKIQPEMKLNVMARLLDSKSPSAGRMTTPKGNQANQAVKGKNTGVDDAKSAGNFLEVIKQLQQQKKEKAPSGGAEPVKQDPERAAALKKKFEALIKEAQERQKHQRVENETKAETEKTPE